MHTQYSLDTWSSGYIINNTDWTHHTSWHNHSLLRDANELSTKHQPRNMKRQNKPTSIATCIIDDQDLQNASERMYCVTPFWVNGLCALLRPWNWAGFTHPDKMCSSQKSAEVFGSSPYHSPIGKKNAQDFVPRSDHITLSGRVLELAITYTYIASWQWTHTIAPFKCFCLYNRPLLPLLPFVQSNACGGFRAWTSTTSVEEEPAQHTWETMLVMSCD